MSARTYILLIFGNLLPCEFCQLFIFMVIRISDTIAGLHKFVPQTHTIIELMMNVPLKQNY